MESTVKSSKDLLRNLKIEPLQQNQIQRKKTNDTTREKLKKDKQALLNQIEQLCKDNNPSLKNTKEISDLITKVKKDSHPKFTSISEKSHENLKQCLSKIPSLSKDESKFASELDYSKYKSLITSNPSKLKQQIKSLKYKLLQHMQFTTLSQTEKKNIEDFSKYYS